MKLMGEESLDTLIPQYAQNKSELDSYKKICDEENKQIKEIMSAAELSEKEVGGWVAKYCVQRRESMNEDILLEIAHHHGIDEIIKTKEYIDFDALEKAIYNGQIKESIVLEMDKAKEVKEIPTLKVSKKKKGE